MYRKSLIVFILCTAFVIAFGLVLNYDASSVNNELQALPTSPTSCTAATISCPSFVIVSAELATMNTTDQLGIANPVSLTVVFNVTGSTPLTKVSLFVGNASGGAVQGPYNFGVHQIVNHTLLATVSASPGKVYLLSVVGYSDSGDYLLRSFSVTDQLRGPPKG